MILKLFAALCVFFFNDTATTEIYTLSLHDALPISVLAADGTPEIAWMPKVQTGCTTRSEEHTSELQSRSDFVCRLLLEKKTCGENPGGDGVAGAGDLHPAVAAPGP